MKVYEMIMKLLEMEAGYELKVNIDGMDRDIADMGSDGIIEIKEDDC